jgi:hypothetical protein
LYIGDLKTSKNLNKTSYSRKLGILDFVFKTIFFSFDDDEMRGMGR